MTGRDQDPSRASLAVGGCAALVIGFVGGLALCRVTPQPAALEPAELTTGAQTSDLGGEAPPAVRLVEPPVTREGVPVLPEPIASVEPPVDSAALAARIIELEAENVELEQLLGGCGGSAYARAWASGELKGATQQELDWVRAILEYAPVEVQAGDTDWLLRRVRLDDWRDLGGIEKAMKDHFGYARVARAVRGTKKEALFEDD